MSTSDPPYRYWIPSENPNYPVCNFHCNALVSLAQPGQLDRIEAKLDALTPLPVRIDQTFIDALGQVLLDSYPYMSGTGDWEYVNRIRAHWIEAQRTGGPEGSPP